MKVVLKEATGGFKNRKQKFSSFFLFLKGSLCSNKTHDAEMKLIFFKGLWVALGRSVVCKPHSSPKTQQGGNSV